MTSEINLFFEPVSKKLDAFRAEGTVGGRLAIHSEEAFPEIDKGTIALFSVAEFRGDREVEGKTIHTSNFREELYQLKDHFVNLNMVDLGSIKPGETLNDTYYAVSSAVQGIVQQGGIALLVGGSQDLTYPNYLAYEKLEQIVNLVSVDSRFDIGEAEDAVTANKYLQKIILHQPNILFNFSNLAYQTHHVLPAEVELMKKMYFDVYRLGEIQGQLEGVEPVVRNADVLSFDLSSIRTSDYPSNHKQEPNGLYGEQACAIARYAGLSDKLSSVGFYGAGSRLSDERSDKLLAQLIWYFCLGAANRKGDYPFADKSTYVKYTVTMEDGAYDVIFYKSNRSDRWWMEVPYPSKRGEKYQRHFTVPCSYSDYTEACKGEMPDRWWQTFQKLG